jgi:hypothetical protein
MTLCPISSAVIDEVLHPKGGGGCPLMKTGINNIYRGFRGRRARFAFEILRFLNDFCDFWSIFDFRRKKWPKVTEIV